MRLWTLHPRYLDAKGLVALWREGLLAQKVLAGETKGYRNHPQLDRFRNHANPSAAIATYLDAVAREAERRGYNFSVLKIGRARTRKCLTATTDQLDFEWGHLRAKLERRNPEWLASLGDAFVVEPHPLFEIVAGPIADWERITTTPETT